jgi:hypothetical protein
MSAKPTSTPIVAADKSRVQPLQVKGIQQGADQDDTEQREDNQQKADLKIVAYSESAQYRSLFSLFQIQSPLFLWCP